MTVTVGFVWKSYPHAVLKISYSLFKERLKQDGATVNTCAIMASADHQAPPRKTTDATGRNVKRNASALFNITWNLVTAFLHLDSFPYITLSLITAFFWQCQCVRQKRLRMPTYKWQILGILLSFLLVGAWFWRFFVTVSFLRNLLFLLIPR